MLKINSIVHGVCKDLSSEGKGVVKINDDVIFCNGLFIDEEADILIEYQRSKVYYGKIKKLYKLSKYRIQPKCKICTSCGGCQFQQLSYEGQIEYKYNRVKQAFKRIAHLDVKIDDVIKMDDPYFYRNKAQMPIGYDKYKNIICGMFKEKTHQIIPVDVCYIENQKTEKIFKAITYLMEKHHILPYDEDKKEGIIRHVLIRTSYHFNEIMVVLVSNVLNFKGQRNFINELIKLCPDITTIVENINSRTTNVILGEKEKILYGKGYIKDTICGLTFKISASSFFQINPIQVEKLYKKALDLLELSPNCTLLDAYSGVGTIGLIASKKCQNVISVELNKNAYLDGIKNAKNNNISNVYFVNDDASDYINKSDISFDAVIMDPPRKGSDEKFLNALINNKVKKICYISCNPETLARDVSYLSKYYKITNVTPVDMFPMTSHVETIVLLCLKETM